MTWQDSARPAFDADPYGDVAVIDPPSVNADLERHVLAKLGGRLKSFSVEEREGRLTLRGEASSYHVKQLAQQEVLDSTPLPIQANRIAVCR